jgi:hypothetical protein
MTPPHDYHPMEMPLWTIFEGQNSTLQRLFADAFQDAVHHIQQGRSILTILATLNERPWIEDYEAQVIVGAALDVKRPEACTE